MRLLIGYGNPLRGDDGIGPYLAEKLGDGWTVITPMQLTPELAEPMSRARRVVFLDAEAGDAPGEVAYRRVEPLSATGAFSHNVTPASLLASARDLYGAQPDTALITVTGARFELSETFSPFIRERLADIVARVAALLTSDSRGDR